MFKLIRWLFLLSVIAALAAFLVGKEIHGKTPAESFCKLIDSPECAKLAARGASEVAFLASRWEAASSHPASQPPVLAKTAEHSSKPARAPAATPAPALPTVPATETAPLDRHTPSERQALDRILSQRGSR